MQPKHPWLQKCVEKLESLPQIKTTTTVEPYEGENALADGLLTVYTPEQAIAYIVALKPNLTLETLEVAIDYRDRLQQRLSETQRPLLIADVLSDAVIDELLERNIEFCDTTGNIYLNNSSVYILVRNRLSEGRKRLDASKITVSTLKVAYALLREPLILKASLQELAEAAGVNELTVKNSLDTLYRLNYLQYQRSGQYRIQNYTKLLERWEMGYWENLRNELLINTFTPFDKDVLLRYLFSEVIIASKSEKLKIIIGGEFGALALTSYLEPISAVLHIPESVNYRALAMKLRLKPDVRGNISILKQFGNKNDWSEWGEWRELNQQDNFTYVPIADPLLIHAELALHPDERLKETASRLYDQYIAKRQEIAER